MKLDNLQLLSLVETEMYVQIDAIKDILPKILDLLERLSKLEIN